VNVYYKRTTKEFEDAIEELKIKYKDQLWFIECKLGRDDLGKQVDVFVDQDIFDPKLHDSIPRRLNGLDVCVIKKPVIRKPKDLPLV